MRAWLLVPLLCVAALGIAALDGEAGLRTWWRLRSDFRSSQQTLERLSRGNDALREEVQALESDPLALERAIREDLGWARSGEVVVLFEEPGADGPAAPLEPAGDAVGTGPPVPEEAAAPR